MVLQNGSGILLTFAFEFLGRCCEELEFPLKGFSLLIQLSHRDQKFCPEVHYRLNLQLPTAFFDLTQPSFRCKPSYQHYS